MKTVDLPWPPSNNRYYRHARGRTYLSKEGREYQVAVGVAACEQHKVLAPTDKRVRLCIEAYPPDRRERDLDNTLKAIQDSLEGIIFQNDSQIDDLRIVRGAPEKGGRVVVGWEVIGDE